MSTTELITAPKRELMLSPVMNLQTANSRLETFQQFVAGYLQESKDGGQDGGDYGPIPGAGKKKVLLKSGADKLCELYGIYDEYTIESHENFETNLFFYRVKCILKSRADDSVVGTGLGSCSTWESKYRYRDSQRKCPNCGVAAIIKGKAEYGGEYICWEKKGGCKTKYKDGDPSIEDQKLGRVENPDILDTVNTVLKMAKKRAKIDAVIGVTRSSGLFTQDMEDLPAAGAALQPEVSTESKTYTRPQAEQDSGGTNNKRPSASSVEGISDGADRPQRTTPPEQSSGPDACIGMPKQRAIHRAFKDAIPPSAAESTHKSAEVIFREWLKHEGFISPEGEGSTKRIPELLFDEVKAKAVKFAESLR